MHTLGRTIYEVQIFMSRLPRVLVPYTSEVVEEIRAILDGAAEVVTSTRDPKDMLLHGGDAVAVISGRVPGEYILHAKSLKMIQAVGAGVDKIDREAVLARGDITVCNSHVNAEEVAEFAIALLLAAAKNIVPSDRYLRAGDWRYTYAGLSPNREIRGSRCLLVGLGQIGSAVAQRLRALEVEVVAATRSGKVSAQDLASEVVPFTEIEPLVRQADFVILTVPLTPETRGMVDGKFLSWMKSSAILVNVSRGEVVDERALYEALSTGRIAGAALDVWWRYPSQWGGKNSPPSRYPFHELDNVIMTPHRAGYSQATRKHQIRFAAENVLRFLRGQTPLNIVDIRRGY